MMQFYHPVTNGELENATQLRERFLGNLLAIMGDTRLLWTPKAADTTGATDESLNARAITWDATVASRLSALGLGYAQSFNGSSQYGTIADQANLSFGNGTTDQAFSVVVLANVTDTALTRVLVSKWAPSAVREWNFRILTTDTLSLTLEDQSAAVAPVRTSNSAITQGTPTLYGATYDGTGGATAANGIILYQNGLSIASTATNNASYVAMEDTTAAVEIGTQDTHTANFLDGSLALVGVCAGVLSAAQMWAIKKLVNAFFGLSL